MIGVENSSVFNLSTDSQFHITAYQKYYYMAMYNNISTPRRQLYYKLIPILKIIFVEEDHSEER